MKGSMLNKKMTESWCDAKSLKVIYLIIASYLHIFYFFALLLKFKTSDDGSIMMKILHG